MAFWGTPREDAWRRRKEREYQRESQIRNEEHQKLNALAARHQRDLEEKEGVLDIARGLLRDARYDGEVARNRIKKQAEGEAGEQEDGEDPAANESPSKKRPRIKKEEDDIDDSGGQNEQVGAAGEEHQAEESVRENLLALSYSMFDSMYGARSFQPKAFCLFLVKQGEKALAEQIAMAAIEKSCGKGDHVSFVLDELLPRSDEPEALVRSVRELLSDVDDIEGKDALLQWFMQRNRTDEAFSTALLVKEENERLKRALPLTNTAVQRMELKNSCTHYLRPDVIGMFRDEDWPAFMQSIPLIAPRERYYQWSPAKESYLEFAAKSMESPHNLTIARYFVKITFENAMNEVRRAMEGFHTSALAQSGVSMLESIRDDAHAKTMKALSKLDEALRKESVRSYLRQVNVDPLIEVAEQFRAFVKLPPVWECTTNHGSSTAAFRCTRCRDQHCYLSHHLGVVRAIREHALTSQSDIFHSIGLPYAPENAIAALVRARVNQEAASALIGPTLNESRAFCRT